MSRDSVRGADVIPSADLNLLRGTRLTMFQLRFSVFAIFVGLSAIACGTTDTPSQTGGSAGTGSGTGGSGGTSGDSGPCPKFDYTNYNPTTSPTLRNDIQPIFMISCALSSSCHQNGSTHPPYLGLSYAQLDGGKPSDAVLQGVLAELNKNSTQVAGRKIAVSGKPEDSYVMNKIDGTHDCSGFVCMGPDRCGVRMP